MSWKAPTGIFTCMAMRGKIPRPHDVTCLDLTSSSPHVGMTNMNCGYYSTHLHRNLEIQLNSKRIGILDCQNFQMSS